MSGLRGWTITLAIRPVSSSPMCVQVLPASTDLYTPSPMTSMSRMAHGSPVPAHTVVGSEGATAKAPIAATGWLSKTGVQFSPASTVFHTPPDAAPT